MATAVFRRAVRRGVRAEDPPETDLFAPLAP